MTRHIQPLPIFDRILDEIEGGRVSDAVLLLAGIMDAAVATHQTDIFRQALREHPLDRFLRSQILSHLVVFAQDAPPPDANATEEKLFHAINRLGFARAIRARRDLGTVAVERAWQRGKRVCLYNCGELGELQRLHGKEKGNICICPKPDGTCGTCGTFDLIIASSTADQCDAQQLADRLSLEAEKLRPDGSILLSAFVPEHLGRGWQAFYLSDNPRCHDEADLAVAAQQSGLKISQFRDASGGLIWAEFRADAQTVPDRGDANREAEYVH